MSPASIASAVRVARKLADDGYIEAGPLLSLHELGAGYFEALDAWNDFGGRDASPEAIWLGNELRDREAALRVALGMQTSAAAAARAAEEHADIVAGLRVMKERPGLLVRAWRYLTRGWS
jgi:hypothetical protein